MSMPYIHSCSGRRTQRLDALKQMVKSHLPPMHIWPLAYYLYKFVMIMHPGAV